MHGAETSPHRLILASAGTGKTYQLSGRFLQLLLDGVPAERILATTFTRKAAGEILDRVLERLMEAAADAGKRRELSSQVGRDLGEAECQAALAQLARNIHRFRIRTLDAFFVQVGKFFALDLGLPADWEIVEEVEDRALRSEAVARALQAAEQGELLALLRNLQRADASRSVENVLLEAVKTARDAWLESAPGAWEAVVAPEPLDEEQLATARAALEALPLPVNKNGSVNANWQKAREHSSRCLDDESWSALTKTGILAKILAGEESYSRHPITPEVLEVFEPILRHTAHHVLAEVQSQNRATCDWLARFELAYQELKREGRAYRFEDLPQALAPPDARPLEGLDLWYRLDGQVHHLLLDEFQDTSPVQWRILEPTADNLIADGTGERSFFCVGDVKQSIYVFREAEPRLLAEMPDHFPALGKPAQLTESYRSSAIVLDTVNRVFEAIGDNGVFAERETYRSAALTWQQGFGEHRAARAKPGAAFLLEAPDPGPDGDASLPPLVLTAQRVRVIANEAPQATIGILLRRNRHIASLILLLRDQGLRASGEGGNPLTDSKAVLHFISLLHLADHPSDTAASFHVSTSALGEAAGMQDSDVARRVRERLAEEGYGAFCASFLETVHVSDQYDGWDARRFDQLVDMAYGFEARAGTRPSAFVEHVRTTAVEDPSAERIKVMTVHAAKGLEFDVVILPELDETKLVDVSILTERRNPAGLMTAVSIARGRETCALDATLMHLREAQERRALREFLSILYVAMTRAIHRLEMIVRHNPAKGAKAPTFARVLRKALAAGGEVQDGMLWRHPENDESWFAARAAEPALDPAPPDASHSPGPLFKPGGGSHRLPRRSPSADEGARRQSPRDLLSSPRARRRGTLAHRWLQEIEWLDDFSLDDDELLALGLRVEPDAKRRGEVLESFRGWLERPATRALLSRPAATGGGDEPEVWRERSFRIVLRDEDGREELWSGSFDRVVLHREGGQVTRAAVTDYKTDRETTPIGLAGLVEGYRPQLSAYRAALAHLLGLSGEAIEVQMLFLEADQVRTV